MIKQALNAATIAEVMSRFVKDDAIKLLGKSTYNKWLKKLPDDRIASNTKLWQSQSTSTLLQKIDDRLRAREATRLQRAQDVSNDLMHRYGPGFEANLPRVNNRLDTRGRLKGVTLEKLPRVNYLKNFTNSNNLISRDELLRWNRNFKAGLDPKTLTSEWYTAPRVDWGENSVVEMLRDPSFGLAEISYNGKYIPLDKAYFNAQLVRNIAAVPYTDPIRHNVTQLVASELNRPVFPAMVRRSIYNAASDNTRKVLNHVNGRNVLEDPVAARLVNSANKHGRLNIAIDDSYKNGTNAVFLPDHNILAVHPELTQDSKNHEWVHYLLYNMDTQKHADIAKRVFSKIDTLRRKNPEYSNLTSTLTSKPREAHEAVTDYLRHELFGTLGSRVDDYKAMGQLNSDVLRTEPVINHIVSETQNLTPNPSLQQALQHLALNYNVPLANGGYRLPKLY